MADCALYGKIGTEADFIRVGSGREAEITLQRWLKASVEQSGGAASSASVRFVKGVGADQGRWAGVWVPSRDSVGRAFPLAVLCPLPSEVDALPLGCLPSGLSRFAEEAEPRLRGLADASLETAREVCAALAPTHASELPHAWGRCVDRAEQRSLREFAEHVFGAEHGEQMYYALHTLRSAAGLRPMPALALPLVDAEDAFVWLELLQAVSPGVTPDLYWTAGPGARLVVSGSDDTHLFGTLWEDEDGASPGVWPVTTRQDHAIDEARTAMSPSERSMFEDGQPLGTRLPSLGGRP